MGQLPRWFTTRCRRGWLGNLRLGVWHWSAQVMKAIWVQAVNEHGGFGTWAADMVVGSAAELQDVVKQHA